MVPCQWVSEIQQIGITQVKNGHITTLKESEVDVSSFRPSSE